MSATARSGCGTSGTDGVGKRQPAGAYIVAAGGADVGNAGAGSGWRKGGSSAGCIDGGSIHAALSRGVRDGLAGCDCEPQAVSLIGGARNAVVFSGR